MLHFAAWLPWDLVTTLYLHIITMKYNSNWHKYTWNHFEATSSEISNSVALWSRIWQGIFAYLCMCHVHLGACLSWLVACKIGMSLLHQFGHLKCTSSWPSLPPLCSLVLEVSYWGMLPEEQDLLPNFFQDPVQCSRAFKYFIQSPHSGLKLCGVCLLNCCEFGRDGEPWKTVRVKSYLEEWSQECIDEFTENCSELTQCTARLSDGEWLLSNSSARNDLQVTSDLNCMWGGSPSSSCVSRSLSCGYGDRYFCCSGASVGKGFALCSSGKLWISWGNSEESN